MAGNNPSCALQKNMLSRCKLSPKKIMELYQEYKSECKINKKQMTFAGLSKRLNVHRHYLLQNQYKTEKHWEVVNFIRNEIYEQLEERCLTNKNEHNPSLIIQYMKSYGYQETINVNQNTHIQKDDVDNLTDEELDNKISAILEKRIQKRNNSIKKANKEKYIKKGNKSGKKDI